MGQIEVLSQHLASVTVESHRKCLLGQTASELRIEAGTFKVWSQNPCKLADTYGRMGDKYCMCSIIGKIMVVT